MKKLLAAAALLTLTAPVYAGMVHIEPDDFIGGGPVTSPYAVLSSIDQFVYEPVYARTLGGGFSAPTGQAVFETSNTMEFEDGMTKFGFSIRFLVPVTEFWIGLINVGNVLGHDVESNCCGVDYAPGDGTYGVPYFTRIYSSSPMGEVLLGGSDQMGGLAFDRISFMVPDVEVPEPGPLGSFAAAMAALAFLKRRKTRAA
jgi:hypothetical protein